MPFPFQLLLFPAHLSHSLTDGVRIPNVVAFRFVLLARPGKGQAGKSRRWRQAGCLLARCSPWTSRQAGGGALPFPSPLSRTPKPRHGECRRSHTNGIAARLDWTGRPGQPARRLQVPRKGLLLCWATRLVPRPPANQTALIFPPRSGLRQTEERISRHQQLSNPVNKSFFSPPPFAFYLPPLQLQTPSRKAPQNPIAWETRTWCCWGWRRKRVGFKIYSSV